MLKLNIEAVLELIKQNFRNNKTFFAETIGVDPFLFKFCIKQ